MGMEVSNIKKSRKSQKYLTELKSGFYEIKIVGQPVLVSSMDFFSVLDYLNLFHLSKIFFTNCVCVAVIPG